MVRPQNPSDPKNLLSIWTNKIHTKTTQKIGTFINNTFLQKIGFNQNTPRVLLYAPAEFGGFEFLSMETIQDQKGISLILRQLQWDKENAQDIRIVLSQALVLLIPSSKVHAPKLHILK
jgi:hypothetical protein